MDTALIEEVVEDFVHLKKRGVNMLGLCPFHNEKSPSFTVSPGKGIYKCFGCGKAGNAVNFIMDHENYSYPEALRYLAAKYNIEVEETGITEEPAEQDRRESLFVVSAFAQKFYTEKLLQSEEGQSIGLSYFKERGFRDEIIEKFQLGYASGDWDALSSEAVKQGFQAEFLEESGLSLRSDQGKLYDRFRGRVMFPVHNLTGRIIAFGGRILKSDPKSPKYVNSPETPIYHKSKVLYGAFFAKKAIRDQDTCYLVEGYTDVISLFQSGIENVVASSGTSLTVEQIRLISRFTKNITMLYDGDPAGIKASLRGLDMILEEGLNVKIVLFPEGHDPDSFVKQVGGAGFRDFIRENEQDFIIFKTNLLLGEVKNDPIKKAGLIHDIVDSIAKIPDSIKAALFVKECSRLLDMEERILLSELNKSRLKSRKQVAQKEEQVAAAEEELFIQPVSELSPNDEAQETEIIRLLLNYGTQPYNEELCIAQFMIQELDDVLLENAVYGRIILLYQDQISRGLIPDENFFIRYPDQQVSQAAVSLLSSPYNLSPNWNTMHGIFVPKEEELLKHAVLSAIFHLKMRKIMRLINENQLKLKEARNEAEMTELQSIHIYLTGIKQRISEALGAVILK